MSASDTDSDAQVEHGPRFSAFVMLIGFLLLLFGLLGRLDSVLERMSTASTPAAIADSGEQAPAEESTLDAARRRVISIIGGITQPTLRSDAVVMDGPQMLPVHPLPLPQSDEPAPVVPARPKRGDKLSRGRVELARTPARQNTQGVRHRPRNHSRVTIVAAGATPMSGVGTRSASRDERATRASATTSTPAPRAPAPRVRPRVVAPRRPEPAPARFISHQVGATDTLWSIAATTYGNGRHYAAIVRANPGLRAEALPVGDTIRLPTPASLGLARQ